MHKPWFDDSVYTTDFIRLVLLHRHNYLFGIEANHVLGLRHKKDIDNYIDLLPSDMKSSDYTIEFASKTNSFYIASDRLPTLYNLAVNKLNKLPVLIAQKNKINGLRAMAVCQDIGLLLIIDPNLILKCQ